MTCGQLPPPSVWKEKKGTAAIDGSKGPDPVGALSRTETGPSENIVVLVSRQTTLTKYILKNIIIYDI